jgi:hypothetical protein
MTGRKLREYGSGTATPYETKQGERWRILWHVPKDPYRPELGTRRVSQRGFTSQREALDALTLVRAVQIRGLQTAPDRDSFTAYANRWLEGYDCSSATRTYVRRVIDAVDPYIGTMRLDQIRPSDLAATFRGLEKGLHQKPTPKRPRPGLAKSTVARYSGWVVTILNAAVHDDIIKKNPAQHPNANRPKGPKARRAKPFRVWAANQVSTFCEWALETASPGPWHGCCSPEPACAPGSCWPCSGVTSTSRAGPWRSSERSTTTRTARPASGTTSGTSSTAGRVSSRSATVSSR